MDVPHDRDDRVLLLRRADHHALVVEQRRGQPVVEQQVPRIIIAPPRRYPGGFGHGHCLERPVGEQPGVAFHVARVVAVVVDTVRVVGQCGEAEQEGRRDLDRALAVARGMCGPASVGAGACPAPTGDAPSRCTMSCSSSRT